MTRACLCTELAHQHQQHAAKQEPEGNAARLGVPELVVEASGCHTLVAASADTMTLDGCSCIVTAALTSRRWPPS
jgi:hypothetical protein